MKKSYSPLALSLFASILFLSGSLHAATTRTKDNSDLIGNYNFRVEIDGVDVGSFNQVDGLSIEQEVIEYQDGEDLLLRKRPGRIKYGDITLKRGYSASSVLNDWIEAARLGIQERKTVSIILDDNSNPDSFSGKRWNLFEAFPKSWKLSTLDGKGNDLVTEELVIAIEWFEEA
jgi:phage tail-like protein